MFGLLGFYVVAEVIISSFLVDFDCLKTSRAISLAFNILPSIGNIQYLCSSNAFFQFFKVFFCYIFTLSNGTYSSHKREWYIY